MKKSIFLLVSLLAIVLIFLFHNSYDNQLEQKIVEKTDEVIAADSIIAEEIVEKSVEKSVELYDFDQYVKECIWYRDLFGKSSYLSDHIGEILTFQVGFWKDVTSDEGEIIYVVYDEVNAVYFIGEENSKSGRIEYNYSDFIQTGLIQIEELAPVLIEVEVVENRPTYDYSEEDLEDIIYNTGNIIAGATTPGTIFLLDYTSYWEIDGENAVYYYVEDEKGKITLHQILGDEDTTLAIYATKDVMTTKQRIAYERVAYNPLHIFEVEEDLQATLIWSSLDENKLAMDGVLEYEKVLGIFRDTLYSDLWSSYSAYPSKIDTEFLNKVATFSLYKGEEDMQYFIYSSEVGCCYLIDNFGEDTYAELLLENFQGEEITELLSTAMLISNFDIPLVLQPKLYVPTEQEKEILDLWKTQYLDNYMKLDTEEKVYIKGFYVECGEVFIDAFIMLANGTIANVGALVTAENDTYIFSPGGSLQYDQSVDSIYTQYYFERLKYQHLQVM
ncbi:MAG: hypothetical protein R3Y47_07315 [Lachnospiraceae bacterium]